MTRYAAGRRKEWAARDFLLDHGASVVIRSAGSKTPVDLVAVFSDAVFLIQCKYVTQGRAWRDANWKALLALPVPPHVSRVAFVYRRGTAEPEIFGGWQPPGLTAFGRRNR